MLYASTNQKIAPVTFGEAVMSGLAEDGGLFVPVSILKLQASFLSNLSSLTFHEICYEVARPFLASDVPDDELKRIVESSFDFKVPLVSLENKTYSLELFHAPTLAFKDFGARFMARVLSYLNRNADRPLTILVATSGDTGSAVAHGFFGIQGISVVLLYPQGKVSNLQEMQMTTLGGNVTALEVQGTFDDCQRLVKEAFRDHPLRQKRRLSSANSINIARLIPQSFYYFYAMSQLQDSNLPVVFSVPSGNFGNLTAGVFAKQMGLPISLFIAATNVNDVVPEYLESGLFKTRPSIPTISNAMDVGNPSNFARLISIYGNVEKMREEIVGASFTDDQTRVAMTNVYKQSGYILDPHGAIGYLGLKKVRNGRNIQGIFLETAHPAKFRETVAEAIGHEIPLPPPLTECLNRKKQTQVIAPRFEELKALLLKAW